MHKRTGEPRPIQDVLRTLLRDSGLGTQRGDLRVFDAWSKAAGERVGGRAVAVKFRNGVLTVEVGSSAQLYELRNFAGEACRQETNALLGTEQVRRVAFKLGGQG